VGAVAAERAEGAACACGREFRGTEQVTGKRVQERRTT
jgi:hypothetical protein